MMLIDVTSKLDGEEVVDVVEQVVHIIDLTFQDEGEDEDEVRLVEIIDLTKDEVVIEVDEFSNDSDGEGGDMSDGEYYIQVPLSPTVSIPSSINSNDTASFCISDSIDSTS